MNIVSTEKEEAPASAEGVEIRSSGGGEASEHDDLIMVVTKDTVEEDESCCGAAKEPARPPPSREGDPPPRDPPPHAAPTPRSSGASGAQAATGGADEAEAEAEAEAEGEEAFDKHRGEAGGQKPPQAQAHHYPHHYHYHHNNYVHHYNQWNPHYRHPAVPQGHPYYYGRYHWNHHYHGQHAQAQVHGAQAPQHAQQHGAPGQAHGQAPQHRHGQSAQPQQHGGQPPPPHPHRQQHQRIQHGQGAQASKPDANTQTAASGADPARVGTEGDAARDSALEGGGAGSSSKPEDKGDSYNAAAAANNQYQQQHQHQQHPHPPQSYPNWPPRSYQHNQGYPGNAYHYYPWNNRIGIAWSNSSVSTEAAVARRGAKRAGGAGDDGAEEESRKRAREESSEERRDDVGEGRDLSRSYTEDTASTLSVGGLSMGSLEQTKASSPKRLKSIRPQNIHRDISTDQRDFPHLDNPSTLSEGKLILQNLSITSIGSLGQSYSAEIAELCGPSPINVDGKKSREFDEGKTPKKRNTSSRKFDKILSSDNKNSSSLVFRLDDPSSSTTPASIRIRTNDDDDSPTMMDLIGGADTPTTGMLLSSMENVLDEGVLSRHLRGQAFTPLPHVLGDDVNFAITPNLSWSINGSPLDGTFERLTPRFGLDSTRSRKNPLASPKSFWKEDYLEEGASDRKKSAEKENAGGVKSILSMLSPAMREMDADPSLDGGPTSPIPVRSKSRGADEGPKSSGPDPPPVMATPLRLPPPGPPAQVPSASQPIPRPIHHGSPWRADHRGPPAYMHSPIPTHHSHHHHHGMSPYDGRYGEHRREGYGMYPPHHHHRYNPDDRIRNLRGRGPPLHHMPPQHHLPPPSYHHFSPLTNVPPRSRWHESQMRAHNEEIMTSSKRNCVPARPPIPAKFQGDMEKYKDAAVPEFNHLVNFPGNISSKSGPNSADGMRCCVMCGQACPCSQGAKAKKGDVSIKSVASSGSSVAPMSSAAGIASKNPAAASGAGFAIIPTQNKGLCTLCDVNVWIVTQTGLEIKWCKGCKNFRPWAAFGDKGLATKCVRCRERQREKYALQKEEKERARGGYHKKDAGSGSMEPSAPKSMGPV